MPLDKEFDELYQQVQNLSETTREYDTKVSDFVSRYGDFINDAFFRGLENTVNSQQNPKKKFLAFFVLHSYLRRNKRYLDLQNLEKKYSAKFGSWDAFDILHLRLEINLPDLIPAESLRKAKTLAEKFPNNDGVRHDYCMLAANLYEHGSKMVQNMIIKDHLAKVHEVIDTVCINKYAKFLWTRARIYSILSNKELDEDQRRAYYETAIASVQEAWMREKPGAQYHTRIATYRNCEMYIKHAYVLESAKREINDTTNQQRDMLQKMKDEYNSLKTENLEIIGFFVAVISFTIGSLGGSSTLTFLQNVFLLVALMGSLLVVYGGLGVVLHGKKKAGRNSVVIIMGIVLISVSVMAGLSGKV